MPVAPYKPITPAGSPDFPQADLSPWDDFDAPQGAPPPKAPPMYPGAVDMYEREQRAVHGAPPSAVDPAEEFYNTLERAREYRELHLRAEAPLPAQPGVPSPPRMMDFGAWLDSRYPEFAGRRVSEQFASSLHQQYQSEMAMAQQTYDNDLQRFGAEIEAAKFLTGGGGRGGRGGGNPIADALAIVKAQQEWMPEEAEAPGSIDAWLTQQLIDGIAPEQVGKMRGDIMGSRDGGTGELPTIPPNTNEGMFWNVALRLGGYKSLDDVPLDVLKGIMREARRQRVAPMSPSETMKALQAAGFDLGYPQGRADFDAKFGPGMAQKVLDWAVSGGASPFEQMQTPEAEEGSEIEPEEGSDAPAGATPSVPPQSQPPVVPIKNADGTTSSERTSNPFDVDIGPVQPFLDAVRAGEFTMDEAMDEIVTAVFEGRISQATGEVAIRELEKGFRPPVTAGPSNRQLRANDQHSLDVKLGSPVRPPVTITPPPRPRKPIDIKH